MCVSEWLIIENQSENNTIYYLRKINHKTTPYFRKKHEGI